MTGLDGMETTVPMKGKLNAVKSYLSESPCVAEISATSPIFKFYHMGVINDHRAEGESKMICSDGEINHAVLLVGWGRDEFLDQEYFVVKNHFGEEWGEKGYARISTKMSEQVPHGTCNILSGVYCPVTASN